MSNLPTDQRCPRCQYPVAPGALVCPSCGLAFASVPPGAPTPPASARRSAPASAAPPNAAFGHDQNLGASTFYGLPPVTSGSQPQGSIPGSQPPAAIQGQRTGVPAASGSTPPNKQKSGKALQIALGILVLVLLLGGGLLAYLLIRSSAPLLQPTLMLTSDYHIGSTPAGAAGTMLHITGQQFAANSAITLLLDAQPAPGAQIAQSDASGAIRADLTISADWSTGDHILTARDDKGHTTQTGVTVVIVMPGQANTPGPLGSPPDDQSFTLTVNAQYQDATTGMAFPPLNESLSIIGHTNPEGGTVCQARDDGQSHQLTGNAGSGVTYQETIIWQCSGSYRGGMLVYTETAIGDQVVFSDGNSCVASTPYVYQQLSGQFTSSGSIMGVYSGNAITLTCIQGGTQVLDPKTGTWTGTR